MFLSIPSHLSEGGVIIHPTDTVFAISCSVFSKKGYDKIYELKKREFKKPLGVLLKDISDIENFTNISLESLAEMIPFIKSGGTLLLPVNPCLPQHLLAQSDCIGVRIPNHEQTKELIKEVGPLIATSANLSGEDPITTSEEAKALFPEAMIIEGVLGSNKPSKILKHTPNGYVLVRA